MGVTVRKNWKPARTSRREHGCADYGIAFAVSPARRSTALQGAFLLFSHRTVGPLMLLSLLAIGLGTTDAYAHARWLSRSLLPTLLLWRLVAMVFGATLVINSMAQVFVAPNFAANGSMVLKTMLFLQILIGGMFFTQSRLTWASVAVLVLPALCAWEFSAVHAIDYAFELVAIGLAMVLMAPALAAPDVETQ